MRKKKKKTVQRCASCRAEKGRLHSPRCRGGDRTLYPDGVTYIAITDYSSPSYDSGSSCGDSGFPGGSDC